MREFLHVDDLADACIFFMEKEKNELDQVIKEYSRQNYFFNVGTGRDISIKNLAFLLKEILGFDGKIIFNESMPDGTYQKLLDISLINSLGWTSKISLKEGLLKTYNWYENNLDNI